MTASTLVLDSRPKRLAWISRLTSLVGVLALMFVYPLGYDPRYYICLAALGLVPLLCGPRLYRWFGAVFLLAALAFAVQQHRAGRNMKAQVERIRAESEAQQRAP